MSDWYKISEISKDTYMIEEPGYVRCFLINGDHKSILIDTGMGMADLKTAITPFTRNDISVLNTHWHFDHIGSNHQYENVGISAKEERLVEKDVSNEFMKNALRYIAEGASFPDGFNVDAYYIRGSKVAFTIDDGDIFDLGSRHLEAIATPGHSEGSMSFLDSNSGILFSGDLMFKGGYLDIQYIESSIDEFVTSLKKLEGRMNDINTVFPSHYGAPVPVEYICKIHTALIKIKADKLGYSEEIIMGAPILIYDFGEFQVFLKKPGTNGIGFREMVF